MSEMGEHFFRHLVFHYTIVFFLFFIPAALSVADLLYAISAAKRLGEPVRSHKLRKTMQKILMYWGFQIVTVILGTIGLLFPWYNLPYLTILATLAIGIIEVKSFIECWRRRKDNMAKIPETVQEIIEFIGKDKFGDVIEIITRRGHKGAGPLYSEPFMSKTSKGAEQPATGFTASNDGAMTGALDPVSIDPHFFVDSTISSENHGRNQ